MTRIEFLELFTLKRLPKKIDELVFNNSSGIDTVVHVWNMAISTMLAKLNQDYMFREICEQLLIEDEK